MIEMNSLKKDIGYIHDESNTRFAEKMEDSVIFLKMVQRLSANKAPTAKRGTIKVWLLR